jgi:hypothetical protein
MAARKDNGTTTIVSQPKETPEGEHGPVDETDPTKRVSSVTAIPDSEAVAVGTVDTVVEAPEPEKPTPPAPRTEEYEATRPNGTKVTVVRNIETGKTTLK